MEGLNRHFSKEDIKMAKKPIWKDAQYHSLLEKGKSKLQWGITSHWSEWPQSKSLQTTNAGGKCAENGTLLHHGNVNWQSHYGKQYGSSFKK